MPAGATLFNAADSRRIRGAAGNGLGQIAGGCGDFLVAEWEWGEAVALTGAGDKGVRAIYAPRRRAVWFMEAADDE